MARIAIQTLGTRGDVQPYLALGQGLRARGHEVSLATSSHFADAVRGLGLAFAPLPDDLVDLIGTPEGKAALTGGLGLRAKFRLLRDIRPMYRRLLDAQWAAAEGADAIIAHPKAIGGPSIAEKRGVPFFMALPLPALSPTRAFPSPLLPVRQLGQLNRASHLLVTQFGDLSFRSILRRWRAEVLGLPAAMPWLSLRGQPVEKLYPYSAAVLPVPDDWGSDSHVTGYWFLDEGRGFVPPAALSAFLGAGPPPVYVGFGSLPSADARHVTDLVIAALRQAGQRGVLATGWGGLAQASMPDSLFMLEQAPHDWLFPQMAAVVHHGGAGTIAAGLRAGRPSVVCPVFGDQPFWGARIHELGAGPRPIPQNKLTVAGLAAAMARAVSDPQMTGRAAALGRAIAAEHGVENAIGLIEAALPGPS